MSLADRMARRVDAVTAGCRAMLPIAADAYAAELALVLGRQGSPSDRSVPGEAPRKQTGQLQASIIVTESYPGQDVVYVGPTAFYAPILLKRNRPFHEITAARMRSKMADLIFEDVRSGSTPAAKPAKRSLGARLKAFFSRRK